MEALQPLSDFGCPVAARDNDGSTAAHWAAAMDEWISFARFGTLAARWRRRKVGRKEEEAP